MFKFYYKQNLNLPRTGMSSSTSRITLPVRNCPGKNRRFELSNIIRNFISLRDIFYTTLDQIYSPMNINNAKYK